MNKFIIVIINQNNDPIESFGPFINRETANLWLDENENQFNGEDAVIVSCTGINQEVLDESVKGTTAAIATALSALIGTYFMGSSGHFMQSGRGLPAWIPAKQQVLAKQPTKDKQQLASEFKIASASEAPSVLAPWEVDEKEQYDLISKKIKQIVNGSMKGAVEIIMARLNTNQDQAVNIVRTIRKLSNENPNKFEETVKLASQQIQSIIDGNAIDDVMSKFNMDQNQATEFIETLRSLK